MSSPCLLWHLNEVCHRRERGMAYSRTGVASHVSIPASVSTCVGSCGTVTVSQPPCVCILSYSGNHAVEERDRKKTIVILLRLSFPPVACRLSLLKTRSLVCQVSSLPSDTRGSTLTGSQTPPLTGRPRTSQCQVSLPVSSSKEYDPHYISLYYFYQICVCLYVCDHQNDD